jgi:hypothetical protein
MPLNKNVIYKLLYKINAVDIRVTIVTREYKMDLSRLSLMALDNNK